MCINAFAQDGLAIEAAFDELATKKNATEVVMRAGKLKKFHLSLFHSLEMVNLAPDIVKAILNGSVPDGFTLSRLRKGIPDDWDEQRREFGFQ